MGMSDSTPRTDAARQGATGKRPYVPVAFSRQLERELAGAKQDSERLDWLLSNQSGYSINGLGTCEAIDAAMGADK